MSGSTAKKINKLVRFSCERGVNFSKRRVKRLYNSTPHTHREKLLFFLSTVIDEKSAGVAQ